jgi:hypothetical protein
MKFEIENGDYVGTAEWRGAGDVALDMTNPNERRFFERYFSQEDAFMAGPVEAPELAHGRRDASQRAFEHAAFCLSAYDYKVRRHDSTRSGAHR